MTTDFHFGDAVEICNRDNTMFGCYGTITKILENVCQPPIFIKLNMGGMTQVDVHEIKRSDNIMKTCIDSPTASSINQPLLNTTLLLINTMIQSNITKIR